MYSHIAAAVEAHSCVDIVAKFVNFATIVILLQQTRNSHPNHACCFDSFSDWD